MFEIAGGLERLRKNWWIERGGKTQDAGRWSGPFEGKCSYLDYEISDPPMTKRSYELSRLCQIASIEWRVLAR